MHRLFFYILLFWPSTLAWPKVRLYFWKLIRFLQWCFWWIKP